VATARERTRAQGKSAKAASAALKITLDGKPMVIDPNVLTIRENYQRRKVLEDAGLPLDDTMLSAAATVWVTLRRDDADVTFDWVLDTMTVGDWRGADPVEDPDSPEA
jgi:hypothetical protein